MTYRCEENLRKLWQPPSGSTKTGQRKERKTLGTFALSTNLNRNRAGREPNLNGFADWSIGLYAVMIIASKSYVRSGVEVCRIRDRNAHSLGGHDVMPRECS